MDKSIRAAFEADYFGDLPATVPARQQGSHGTYTHADPQHAWTIWQRAWHAAAAELRRRHDMGLERTLAADLRAAISYYSGQIASTGDMTPTSELLGALARVEAALASAARLAAQAMPVPAAQGDALDAERLDWLTSSVSGKALRDIGVVWSEHSDARRAIDAARAAKEGASNAS